MTLPGDQTKPDRPKLNGSPSEQFGLTDEGFAKAFPFADSVMDDYQRRERGSGAADAH